MSFGKIVALMAEPEPPIVALPVFVSRVFRHSAIYVRKGSGIRQAEGPGGPARRRAGVGADRDHLRARHAGARVRRRPVAASPGPRPGCASPAASRKCPSTCRRACASRRRPSAASPTCWPRASSTRVISARDPGGERMFPDYPRARAGVLQEDAHLPDHARGGAAARRLRARPLDRDEPAAGVRGGEGRSLARAAEIGASAMPVPWVADHTRRWREVRRRGLLALRHRAEPADARGLPAVRARAGRLPRRLAVEELFAPETRERFKI